MLFLLKTLFFRKKTVLYHTLKLDFKKFYALFKVNKHFPIFPFYILL